MQTGTITLENYSVVSTKVEHMHILSANNPVARHIHKRNKCICIMKNHEQEFSELLFIIDPSKYKPSVHQSTMDKLWYSPMKIKRNKPISMYESHRHHTE